MPAFFNCPKGYWKRLRTNVIERLVVEIRRRIRTNAVCTDLQLVIGLDFSSNARMPDWLAVVVLGIVEGITEFLPISSTGHILLVDQCLGRHSNDLFVTVIQCGAVLAVILVFWSRVVQLATGWREPKNRDYILKLVIAFAITGAGGLVLKKLGFKLPERAGPVAWATLIGGVVIGIVEQLAGYFLPAGFQEVTSNVVLLATLILRPQGLIAEGMGKRV